MARRKLIWHLGLADAARPVIPPSLDRHREVLAEQGLVVVADRHEADLATHELLRTHREAGLRRSEVEGRWAAVADRVWAHRGTSIVSTPELGAADRAQLRLALDPLIGIEVHLVVTAEPFSDQVYGAWVGELLRGAGTGWKRYAGRVERPLVEPGRGHEQADRFWAGHELGSLLARWGWTLHADRLHVVTGDPETHWAELLRIAGADLVQAPPAVVAPHADPAPAAVLREVNRRSERPLSPVDRRLVLTGGDLGDVDAGERAPMPRQPWGAGSALVERWETQLRTAGHDVRGDLHTLLACERPAGLPGPRQRLATAAEELAEALQETTRLRARVAELEQDNARLDGKRRQWKRRATRDLDESRAG